MSKQTSERLCDAPVSFDAKMAIRRVMQGSMLRLEKGAGTTVGVLTGNVWLTQYRDHTDYLLRPGDQVVLSGLGTTLVYAFENTLLRFSTANEAHFPSGVEPRSFGFTVSPA